MKAKFVLNSYLRGYFYLTLSFHDEVASGRTPRDFYPSRDFYPLPNIPTNAKAWRHLLGFQRHSQLVACCVAWSDGILGSNRINFVNHPEKKQGKTLN